MGPFDSIIEKEKPEANTGKSEGELSNFNKIFEILDEMIYNKVLAIPVTTSTMRKYLFNCGVQCIDSAESSIYRSMISSFCLSIENTHKNEPTKINDKEWAQIKPLIIKYIELNKDFDAQDKRMKKKDYDLFLNDLDKFSDTYPNFFDSGNRLRKTQERIEKLIKMNERLDKIKNYREKMELYLRSEKPIEKAEPYIEKFRERYMANGNEDDLRQLQRLLIKKGIICSDDEVICAINQQEGMAQEDSFRSKVQSRNPKQLDDYVRIFLDIYGEHYFENLSKLESLLSEKFPNKNFQNLDTFVANIKADIETEIFEKNLFEKKRKVSINDLDVLDGYEFQKVVGELFQKMGYVVENTPLSGDQGADLILTKFGEKVVVQAKRYEDKVTNGAIQEAVAAIKFYGARRAIVITTGNYTKSAHELAKANDVELIDREVLTSLIAKYM